jgi:beta-glucanase (GH16 family)
VPLKRNELTMRSSVAFALAHVVAAAYETDFTTYDTTNWQLLTGCAHCGGASGFGAEHTDECTQNTEEAASFGSKGLTITTTKLAKASPCGGECESAHITYTPWLTYGKFTARAIWYPESANSSATGFMGLDADGNEGSITFGFHGKAWSKFDGSHNFQTGIYANVKKSHNQEVIDAGVILAEEHEFAIHWHPDKVLWFVDGKEMRKELDSSVVPQMPMRLRLHSRSGYCSQLGATESFTARFTHFDYAPFNETTRVFV